MDWQSDDVVDDVALLVTELVTNSVLHARSSFAVELSSDGAGVRIAVSDRSRRGPGRKHLPADSTTGRGLTLIEALTAEWGVDSHPDGKTVWCTLATGGGASQPPSRPDLGPTGEAGSTLEGGGGEQASHPSGTATEDLRLVRRAA
jgi:hypothetical protein